MNKMYLIIAAVMLSATAAIAQNSHIAEGLASVTAVVGETRTIEDSVAAEPPVKEIPLWKQKLYYGYNFDIYFHHDSRPNRTENGWSIALTPEIGWKLKERVYLGLRFGGSYANYKSSFTVTGIWLEAHLYTGMDFPRVTEGNVTHTDFDGLRHAVTYGFQLSPVITYQFNRKSTFQMFFSILSLGYSGTAYCYTDHNEYTNDVIIFSGKLSNLVANQFTPGLYGLKFGIQKSF